MKRAIFLLVIVLALNACSDRSKSATQYTFITDHYSSDIQKTVISALSIYDYSPCPNLSRPTHQSKVIRYDLPERNESKLLKRNLLEALSIIKITEDRYKKKIDRFAYPIELIKERNAKANPKNIEYYINSLDPSETKIFGLNSVGIQYKGLNLNHTIQHFQNIYDLKDAFSDYICNEIGEKHAVVLVNLFTESGLEDCLSQCEELPYDPVCADDGKEYRNISCLNCYDNLNQISCDRNAPLFRKEQLTSKAFEIFYQFAEAQNLIANDKNSKIAEDLIDNTLRLFDENKKIEILNLGTKEPIRFTTKQYLKRLLNRPFDQIDMEWNKDWTVTQEWTDAGTEIPESELVAEGEQYFAGYRKSLVAYSDAIKKNVHFHARLIETIDENGNEVLDWKVFIGDITIASRPSEL